MYDILKQYLIEPFARILFGDYESEYKDEEKRNLEQYVLIRRICDQPGLSDKSISIDEICWNELGSGGRHKTCF